MEERGLKKKRTKAGVEYEDVAIASSTSTTFQELVDGVEGAAPEPSSLRETTIENKGCRATPLHHCRDDVLWFVGLLSEIVKCAYLKLLSPFWS